MLCRPVGAGSSETLDSGWSAKWGARRMRIAQVRQVARGGAEQSPKGRVTVIGAPSAKKTTMRGKGEWVVRQGG
ncbi:MAG TPA: hypothetical protein VIQ74_14655 [Gemmatimonadaceae bacterium]|jgi:hypothetical protein